MSSVLLIKKVLNFWFGDQTSPEYGKPRSFWFMSTPEIDRLIRQIFGNLYQLAVTNDLDPWMNTPEGSLSLVIILDQFSRNMFRGITQSFATDSKALDVAKAVIEKQLPNFSVGFFTCHFLMDSE